MKYILLIQGLLSWIFIVPTSAQTKTRPLMKDFIGISVSKPLAYQYYQKRFNEIRLFGDIDAFTNSILQNTTVHETTFTCDYDNINPAAKDSVYLQPAHFPEMYMAEYWKRFYPKITLSLTTNTLFSTKKWSIPDYPAFIEILPFVDGIAKEQSATNLLTPKDFASLLNLVFDGNSRNNSSNSFIKSIKATHPATRVVMGTPSNLTSNFVKQTIQWCAKNRSFEDVGLPFDIINFKHQSSSNNPAIGSEWQQYSLLFKAKGSGTHPESIQEELKVRIEQTLTNTFLGTIGGDDLTELKQKKFWLSEIGYDVLTGTATSPVSVAALGNNDKEVVQGQWLMRTILEATAAAGKNTGNEDDPLTSENARFLDRLYLYTLQDDAQNPSGLYQGSGLLKYNGTPKRAWYYVQTLKNVLSDYYFDSEIGQQNGTKAYKFRNAANQVAFAIWKPTANGGEASNLTCRLGSSQDTPTNFERYTVEEGDENGIMTAQTSSEQGGYRVVTLPVSETPVFIKEAMSSNVQLGTRPTAVSNLTATPECCGSVKLSWTKNGTYKYYAIYYAPATLATTGDFGTYLPQLTLFTDQLFGLSSSVTVTGLTPTTAYKFFVIPYNVYLNRPQIASAVSGTHFIQATVSGDCTANADGYCIYTANINNVVMNNTLCPAMQNDVQRMFGVFDNQANGCAKVNFVPADNDAGWTYAQNNAAECQSIIYDFTANGRQAQLIKSVYIRSKGATGQVKIQFETCDCPGYFFDTPTVTLSPEIDSKLDVYTLFPLTPIKRIRITRLNNAGTKIQRIYFCSKNAPGCTPSGGATDIVNVGVRPSNPTNMVASDITPTTALIEWSNGQMNRNDVNSPGIGSYKIDYSKTKNSAGELVNPVSIKYAADINLSDQMFRLTELSPGTTYFLRIKSILNTQAEDFPPCASMLTISPELQFKTPAEEIEMRSENATALDKDALLLTIFPTPNDGRYSVQFPTAGYNLLEIIDLNGKVVHQQQMDIDSRQLDMQVYLSAGFYTLRISNTTNGLQAQEKLIIQ